MHESLASFPNSTVSGGKIGLPAGSAKATARCTLTRSHDSARFRDNGVPNRTTALPSTYLQGPGGRGIGNDRIRDSF